MWIERGRRRGEEGGRKRKKRERMSLCICRVGIVLYMVLQYNGPAI